MKICWDNLIGLWLTKKGNFRKNDCTYYEVTCKYCSELCLVSNKKKGKYCNISCAKKAWLSNPENHPSWKGGISVVDPIAYGKKWRKLNSNRRKNQTKEWRRLNLDHHRDYRRNWAKKNLDKRAAQQAKRRAAKLNQTPLNADQKKIKGIYYLCHRLNVGAGRIAFNVDHVIPLSRGGFTS